MPVHPYRLLPFQVDRKSQKELYARRYSPSKLPASLAGKALGLCYRVIDAGAVRI